MPTTFSVEEVLAALPPEKRASYLAMPPEVQEMLLPSLTDAVADSIIEQRAALEVPAPPVATSWDIASATLIGDEHADQRAAERVTSTLDLAGAPVSTTRSFNQSVTLLTVGQAANQAGVSESTLRRRIRAGLLPVVRIRHGIRIRTDLLHLHCQYPDRAIPQADRSDRWFHTEDMGLPIDEVARILLMHPDTVRGWKSWLGPDFFAIGVGLGLLRDVQMVPARTLEAHHIPYRPDRLQPMDPRPPRGRLQRKRRSEYDRRAEHALEPSRIKRTDRVLDPDGTTLRTIDECAGVLGLTESGAYKALRRAGVPWQILGGKIRVRTDDLLELFDGRFREFKSRTDPEYRVPDDDDPRVLSLADAAARFGVHTRTLRRWIAAKKIPAQVVGSKLVLRASDVDFHLRERDQTASLRDEHTRSSAAAARRGADLTAGHIDSYVEWARENPRSGLTEKEALLDRRTAADRAGCRPSVIEDMVRRGLLPARRCGRDLQIRFGDLYAAAALSPLVGRMCPGAAPRDKGQAREVNGEYATIEIAADILKRPSGEILDIIERGQLLDTRFGRLRRIHMSQLEGAALERLRKVIRPYRPLKWKVPGAGRFTVPPLQAANEIGVSERTIQRWCVRDPELARWAGRVGWVRDRITGMPMRGFKPQNRGGRLLDRGKVVAIARIRQARGDLARDLIGVTTEQLRSGSLPQLQPWQEFRVVDAAG